MTNSDSKLQKLIAAIADRNPSEVARLLAEDPALAKAHFEVMNATRQAAEENFVSELSRYIYRGDTALHFAAAAYDSETINALISFGGNAHARNRLGDEPLHAAATGIPASKHWNPEAQSAAIRALIQAGADPNALNKMGVGPLHKAVRTRCARAVRTLLESGADPTTKNRHGSDALLLAKMSTGRGGSGSPEAKEQQLEIIRLLERAETQTSRM